MRYLASVAALALVCFWYTLNSGVATSLSCVHRPAIWWLCGPPCSDGKTAKLMASSYSYLGAPSSSLLGPRRKKIMPERGPRSDLCVVVVTMSHSSNGDLSSPVATMPEMCAMSAISMAPTLSQILRTRS